MTRAGVWIVVALVVTATLGVAVAPTPAAGDNSDAPEITRYDDSDDVTADIQSVSSPTSIDSDSSTVTVTLQDAGGDYEAPDGVSVYILGPTADGYAEVSRTYDIALGETTTIDLPLAPGAKPGTYRGAILERGDDNPINPEVAGTFTFEVVETVEGGGSGPYASDLESDLLSADGIRGNISGGPNRCIEPGAESDAIQATITANSLGDKVDTAIYAETQSKGAYRKQDGPTIPVGKTKDVDIGTLDNFGAGDRFLIHLVRIDDNGGVSAIETFPVNIRSDCAAFTPPDDGSSPGLIGDGGSGGLGNIGDLEAIVRSVLLSWVADIAVQTATGVVGTIQGAGQAVAGSVGSVLGSAGWVLTGLFTPLGDAVLGLTGTVYDATTSLGVLSLPATAAATVGMGAGAIVGLDVLLRVILGVGEDVPVLGLPISIANELYRQSGRLLGRLRG
jgi:hypothetical protein